MDTNHRQPCTVVVPSNISGRFLKIVIPQPDQRNKNILIYFDTLGNIMDEFTFVEAAPAPQDEDSNTPDMEPLIVDRGPNINEVEPGANSGDSGATHTRPADLPAVEGKPTRGSREGEKGKEIKGSFKREAREDSILQPRATTSRDPKINFHRHPAHEVIVDVNELAESVYKKLENLHPSTDNLLCIYKTPEQLRELNEKAYTPRLVSIGPFHYVKQNLKTMEDHGKQNLKPMEDHKKIYLQEFFKSINNRETFFESIKWHEPRLRASYARSIELDKVEFLTMMLVDGVFILGYLMKRFCGLWARNDQVFNHQRLTNTIRFDILLLENQLPFFFLEHLLGHYGNGVSLVEMVYRFMKESFECNWLVKDKVDSRFERIQVKHLLHFLSICLQPSERRRGKELKIRTTPTIAQLHSAGVKFEGSSCKHFLDKECSCKHFLDIEFKNGILQIPTWKITDDTEILFRNLIAFEQCNHGDHYLTDYVALMDMLIDDSKDVELLVENGIIEHWLQHDQEVATLVNGLGKHNIIREKEFLFADQIEDLNEYYKKRWHRYKATLKQQYFNNPWTVISVIAAGFLLLLTVVQTVCSILQVL